MLGRGSLGNKNERDNSEAERLGDESKRRPEEERSKEPRREGTSSGGTRSILREESEEVMDGTSVMVQPSISRTYTFIIYYSCRCGYSSSGALFLSPLAPRRIQRPVTKQRFRYKVHTRRYAQTSFPRTIRRCQEDLSRVIHCNRAISKKRTFKILATYTREPNFTPDAFNAQ